MVKRINIERYQKLANRITDDYNIERPVVVVLPARTMERMAGGPTPGFCEDDTICLRPDADDIVFFHEIAHYVGAVDKGRAIGEMEADSLGFDLEAKYLGRPRPAREATETFSGVARPVGRPGIVLVRRYRRRRQW